MCVSDGNLILITNDGTKGISVLKTDDGAVNPVWHDRILLDNTDEPVGLSIGGINNDVIVLTTSRNVKAYSLNTKQLLLERPYCIVYPREAYCFDVDKKQYLWKKELTSYSVEDIHRMMNPVIDHKNWILIASDHLKLYAIDLTTVQ